MRKFWLGIVFVASGTFLIWAGIQHGSDLIGLSTAVGSLAAGVLAIVWGNSREWAAKTNGKTE